MKKEELQKLIREQVLQELALWDGTEMDAAVEECLSDLAMNDLVMSHLREKSTLTFSGRIRDGFKYELTIRIGA